MAEVATTSAEGAESITDIQNYLQSFNKEIAIDDGTLQMLAEQASGSSGNTATATIPVSGADGQFQTVAIVPDGDSGGYVLIVQQPDEANSSPAKNTRTRIKQEKNEKTNDISVYDFDDANAVAAHGNDAEMEDGDDVDGAGGDDDDEDVKPDVTSTPKFKTPKKKAVASSSVKKQKGTPSSASSSNQHMCNYCNYTSSKRYLLSRHMKSHSEERPHKCGICERGFKTIASLQNHVNTHTGVRPHGCKYCEAAFTTSGELVRHVRYRHTHEKPHRCTECDYASVELSKLKRHMRCHTGERPYQCPHCTYASPDTYKLKRHLRIHTGEKPYECDVCHARFTQSNSLKAHRLIHSGNKPVFKCELCPTTCGRKTDLRIHVQKLHTSEKLLTCKRCDQSFPDRYHFKMHLKTHEGEKCFKCDLCNYASVSARHLESHMLIHTDQKPYNCDECEQSFRQKQLLKRHKNLYHNPDYIPPQPKEKTHECPSCNKAFRHKGNLMRHLAVHDPDAYKDQNNAALRGNDSHQLIDEESEEEDDEDSSQMILPNESDDTIDPQTLQFTLDPQTQQMLQGEQVVVFEVVQLNNSNQADNDNDGSYTTAVEHPVMLEQTPILPPRRGGRRGKLVRQNGASTSNDNIIIQLAGEDEEAANTIQGESIIDDPDYTPSGKTVRLSAASAPLINQTQSSVPPPPLVTEDTKNLRDQIQKQKDMANCFGFQDDDEEDDAILSMPAVHGQ